MLWMLCWPEGRLKVTHTPVFAAPPSGRKNRSRAEPVEADSGPAVTLETSYRRGFDEATTNPTGKMLVVNFWATWWRPVCGRDALAPRNFVLVPHPRLRACNRFGKRSRGKSAALKTLQDMHASAAISSSQRRRLRHDGGV